MLDKVIDATKKICEFKRDKENDHLSSFEKPGLALKLGYSLEKISSAAARALEFNKCI